MLPFPNLIAGVLIGIWCDKWIERLISPFLWGIVFCAYTWIFEKHKQDAFIAKKKGFNHPLKWGMSPLQAFYFGEYMIASLTSLIFSGIAGAVKGLL